MSKPNDMIKLVIWDLDDTFWKGTLSEGDIQQDDRCIELVKKLTDRGIVNSICSKNDFDDAKKKLTELGIWDYFVFPSINWENKGARVRNIITDMQLRPTNVLFVDDNRNNLQEALFFCEGLKIALPNELFTLCEGDAFIGKDDKAHERLLQYRLLETRQTARKNSSTNEDFLRQSNIRVTFIEDVSDLLGRIHEMIHRNNQLNFTKDRITLEEVETLFLDPNVTCGCIKVTDRYGDHGIVGCYAVKEDRLAQFVFSCRILGMGVEQWVYAKLGFPKLTVVGDVATVLNETETPDWITEQAYESKTQPTEEKNVLNKKLLLYGSCSLRPTWAYLEASLPNARFDEIDPDPAICNLAAIIRENEATRRAWLEKVNAFDARYTFDKAVFSSDTDYLLISLSNEFFNEKYTNHKDGSYFFAHGLTAETVAEGFLDDYDCTPITKEDIEENLTYICEHLSDNTTLLIQTVPEVVFLSKGKDQNYYDRLELNRISTALSEKYPFVKLIDLRKYASRPSDFFNTWANHFNRSIGYSVAQEILSVINDANVAIERVAPVKKTQQITINKQKAEASVMLINGKLSIKLAGLSEDTKVRYEFWRNRVLENTVDYTLAHEADIQLHAYGLWRIRVYWDTEACFTTEEIDFNEHTYPTYLQDAEGKAEFYHSFAQRAAENSTCAARFEETVNHISELSANGVSIAEYFLKRGITSISLLVDHKTAQIIIPYLDKSPISIDHIYTTSDRLAVVTDGGCRYYGMEDLNTPPVLTEKDVLLYAVNDNSQERWLSLFRRTQATICYLPYILSELMTQHLFVNKIKQLKAPVIVVKTANLSPFHGFPYQYAKPSEKTACRLLKNSAHALSLAHRLADFPEQFANYSVEKLRETLTRPQNCIDRERAFSEFADISGKFVTIKDGMRYTVGSPPHADRTVYLYGTSYAYGCGVSDGETVASALQFLLGSSYRVCNCANCWDEWQYGIALNRMFQREYKPNDVVILLVSNWQPENAPGRWHWLNTDAMQSPAILVDATPLFMHPDRPNYFLLPGAYTADANKALAKLIYDSITSLPEQ